MFCRILLLSLVAVTSQAQSPDASDWGHYGGDIFGQRYSSLAEIDRSNVAKLAVAWQFRTGELGEGLASADRLAFEATPVLAFGLLYLSTPADTVIALDPATGRERWRYDPHLDRLKPYAQVTSRGVSVWEDAAPSATCARRVFIGTVDARLIGLNAETGQPCGMFGRNGILDLKEGAQVRDPNRYSITSPPALYGGLIIVNLTSGGVRAFDARSGAARWTLDSAPSSAVMSVDPDRGLVFVPSSNTLLALDVTTGKRVWQQELVHHDLWGFDLAAQPALLDLESNKAPSSVLLQATPTGMLFVLARGSGKPFVPIVEQKVPTSRMPGVHASLTQPFPVTPSLVIQNRLEPQQAWGITFWDRTRCRKMLERYRNEGIYTPPDARGTLLWPGPQSGVGWGGVAFDARRQRVFAAVNHWPALMTSQDAKPLLSPLGLPCTPPPWGTLASVDLIKNEIVWQVPLGSTQNMGPWFAPARNFGTPNLAGPIVTAGDLVFIGATTDRYFRAFDLETGRELWKHRLPAGGQATPMTYRTGPHHRQFVVIAAGGHGDWDWDTPRGDYVIAFALPK